MKSNVHLIIIACAGAVVMILVVCFFRGPSPNGSESPSGKNGRDIDIKARSAEGSRIARHIATAKSLSSDEVIERAHAAIVETVFPADPDRAQILFEEELGFILLLSPSRDREFLIKHLVENFTNSLFGNTDIPGVIAARLQSLYQILSKVIDGAELEMALDTAAVEGAKQIRAMPTFDGALLDELLKGGKAIMPDQINSRVAGAYQALLLERDGVIDLAKLEAIENQYVRMHAERALFKNFDLSSVSEGQLNEMARFYLSEESYTEPDHEISVRIFGLALTHYPETISKEILDARPSKKRDQAIEQMIFRIAPEDPEFALLWFAEIQDPAIRRRAEIDISGKRARANPPPYEAVVPGTSPFD